MDRVLIIGCSAGGKSTVARELGQILGIDVIHLDKLLWKPGCRLTEESKEPDEVRQLLDRPRWIMDGNYTASLPIRLGAADTVVFIDYPRRLCLTRAFKRLFMYLGRTRPDMGAGCPERLNFNFLRWIWNYPKHERPKLLQQLQSHANHALIVTLHSPKEADRWLDQVRRQAHELHDAPLRSQTHASERTDRRTLSPVAGNR